MTTVLLALSFMTLVVLDRGGRLCDKTTNFEFTLTYLNPRSPLNGHVTMDRSLNHMYLSFLIHVKAFILLWQIIVRIRTNLHKGTDIQ